MDSLLIATQDKKNPRGKQKTGPNSRTIQQAFNVLIAYGSFRWSRKEGYEITPHDGSRVKYFITQAEKDVGVTRGRWNKHVWLGFAILSHLVRNFLQHSLDNGALTFDIVIAKCLSMVLISSLGARVGDVARSPGYNGSEYMKYRNIDSFILPGTEAK